MTRILFHFFLVLALLAAASSSAVRAAESEGVAIFHKKIEPILDRFCSDCHAAGSSKGKVSFDRFESASPLEQPELWSKTLKMLRAEMMPPKGKPRPTAEQIDTIAQWIKGSVFRIDPKDPDPGRVTVRRLNRIEYRNTIRDLMGVDYNTEANFPPDDTGHGFDNLGDVLSLSPLLLEKYIAAARTVVGQAVPVVPWAPAEKRISGRLFAPKGSKPASSSKDDFLSLSYYKPAVVSYTFLAEHPGPYQLIVDLAANETFVDGSNDYNKCRLIFKSDGKVLLDRKYTRQGRKEYRFEFDQDWKAGPHEWTFELQPLTPNEKQVRSLVLRIEAVTARGPINNKHGVRPRNYARFFPESVPDDPAGRRQTARDFAKLRHPPRIAAPWTRRPSIDWRSWPSAYRPREAGRSRPASPRR